MLLCQQAKVSLEGSPLDFVTEFKYLGVTIDSSLTFKKHNSNITFKTYGVLSTLRKAQTYLPLSTQKLVYKAFLLPHLEYCPTIFWSIKHFFSPT